METVGRLVVAFFAVILILLNPLKYIAFMQEETMEDVINQNISEFTEEACNQGRITLESYEELIYKMDRTGELFDVSIETTHPVTGKEIIPLTVGDKIPNVETKLASYSSDGEIMNNGVGPITLFASHSHMADCYVGHNHNVSYCSYHTHTGSSTSGGGCYGSPNYHSHNSSCYGNAACGLTVSPQVYISGSYFCSVHKKNENTTTYRLRCSAMHDYGFADVWPCLGQRAPSSFTCSSQTNKLICSISTTTPISYYINCGRTSGYQCGLSNDSNAICSSVVTSITATNPTQRVEMGGAIISTATATYLDGHTGTVNCTVTGYNPNVLGSQAVTLTYSGLVGNARTSGTRTCTVNITVETSNYPTGLTITPSTYDVYDNKEPTYTVVVHYKDGTARTIAAGYTKTGWTTGIGQKTVTFNYTENGHTVTGSVIINVLPNLTSISASPSSQHMKRYSNPSFTVQAFYEDGSSKTILSGYTITGLDTSLLGTQNVTISYTVNGRTKSTTALVVINELETTCPICGITYELNDENVDEGCPNCSSVVTEILVTPTYVKVQKGNELPVNVSAVYQNGVIAPISGWTSNYDPNFIGINEVTVCYQGFEVDITVETVANEIICPICEREYSTEDDETDNGCPYCSIELVSIDVVEESVEIERFQALPINVIGTFKDGHTEVITNWTSDLLGDTPGTFVVTVFYQSATDTLAVTILSNDRVTCEYCGLEYIRSESPDGCPVCSKTIVSIEAKLRNGRDQVLCKSPLNLELTLIYKDTHREVTFTGYSITGYQPEQLGTQTVTVFYESLFTTLTIEVISGPAKATCPKGHEYYLEEDGTDIGCPYCNEDAEKDNAIFYFDITYTNEIIYILYQDGAYYLSKGDYLTVEAVQRNRSIRSRLIRMSFFNESMEKKKRYIVGGEVK